MVRPCLIPYSVCSDARMGDAEHAYEMFCRCYQPNLRAPFGVLAETPTSDNPYFRTGPGGLLQAVIMASVDCR